MHEEEEAEAGSEEDAASGSGSGGDSGSDEDKEDEFRVQHLLARRCLTPSQWRQVCGDMTTREITRGSFFIQPDEEYFSDSLVQVEKFLVKWAHASYLHVSWETEKDIVEQTGAAGKAQLKKFRIREALKQDLFEDLGPGEFFLPSFVQVDRILDLDDDVVDKMLEKFVQTHKVKIPINRIDPSKYLFGTKIISAQIINGILMVRVGGGFMTMEEFVDKHTDKEILSLKLKMAKERKKLPKIT
jgi:hypothetical protein